ncbi:phosphatidylinositol transfer protein 2-like [Artemia franciscana]|uniref:phosphatidylinositol transfer protein 2-like n=1 Tax=Artemia franciscana TaxID=6661 RepID=UPI0032DBBD16
MLIYNQHPIRSLSNHSPLKVYRGNNTLDIFLKQYSNEGRKDRTYDIKVSQTIGQCIAGKRNGLFNSDICPNFTLKYKEYNFVVLPLTVEEYQIGQLYSVGKASKELTNADEGVEIRKNEPFENVELLGGKYTKGQYTLKNYYVRKRLPTFIQNLLPGKIKIKVEEEAWNAYPYCKTVLTKTGSISFKITVETFHAAGAGDLENALSLDDETLKKRKVVYIDIANAKIAEEDYKLNEDPTKFKSEKTGRGPLTDSWKESVKPLMTCYKLIRCDAPVLGLQRILEPFAINQQEQIFLNFHRKLFCSLDEWYGMTMQDIRAYETRVQQELKDKQYTDKKDSEQENEKKHDQDDKKDEKENEMCM